MNEFSNARDSYFKLKVMYKNTYFEDNRKKEILRPIIAYSAKNYHTFGRIRVVDSFSTGDLTRGEN